MKGEGGKRQERKEGARGGITGNFSLKTPRHRRNSNTKKDPIISAIRNSL